MLLCGDARKSALKLLSDDVTHVAAALHLLLVLCTDAPQITGDALIGLAVVKAVAIRLQTAELKGKHGKATQPVVLTEKLPHVLTAVVAVELWKLRHTIATEVEEGHRGRQLGKLCQLVVGDIQRPQVYRYAGARDTRQLVAAHIQLRHRRRNIGKNCESQPREIQRTGLPVKDALQGLLEGRVFLFIVVRVCGAAQSGHSSESYRLMISLMELIGRVAKVSLFSQPQS